MQRIALITDSSCGLPPNVIKEKNIHLLPLKIIYSTENYQDNTELASKEVHENSNNELPKTSLPSIQTLENVLSKIEFQGYTHIIAISMSSALSGSYSSLKLCLEGHPELKSYVYDSKTLDFPQGEIVLEVSNLIELGKTFEEIIKYLPIIRNRVTGYFTINTLEHLKKGVKIGIGSGGLNKLLNVKPIITTDENGIYYTVCKALGRKHALSKITELLKEHLSKGKSEVTVLQSGCETEAIRYMNSIKHLPNILSLKINEISPTLGAHTGPGLMGFSIKLVE